MYKNEIKKFLQDSTGTASIFSQVFEPNNVDKTGLRFICTEDIFFFFKHSTLIHLHFSELCLLN